MTQEFDSKTVKEIVAKFIMDVMLKLEMHSNLVIFSIERNVDFDGLKKKDIHKFKMIQSQLKQ